MGQFRQPDFSKGDPNTLGGYVAVHERPAAFEGSDGFSYSVEILADRDDTAEKPWGAYLLFVKWARIGASAPEGHLETDVIAHGRTHEEATARAGSLPLNEVKGLLDRLITQRAGAAPQRKWWDAMADDGGDDQGGT